MAQIQEWSASSYKDEMAFAIILPKAKQATHKCQTHSKLAASSYCNILIVIT